MEKVVSSTRSGKTVVTLKATYLDGYVRESLKRYNKLYNRKKKIEEEMESIRRHLQEYMASEHVDKMEDKYWKVSNTVSEYKVFDKDRYIAKYGEAAYDKLCRQDLRCRFKVTRKKS